MKRDDHRRATRKEGIACDGYFYIPLFAPFLENFPALTEHYGAGKDWRSAMRTPIAERAAYEESIWPYHPLFMGDTKDVDDIVAALEKIYENRGELGREANDSKDRY